VRDAQQQRPYLRQARAHVLDDLPHEAHAACQVAAVASVRVFDRGDRNSCSR
jgi:hypothetical protein